MSLGRLAVLATAAAASAPTGRSLVTAAPSTSDCAFADQPSPSLDVVPESPTLDDLVTLIQTIVSVKKQQQPGNAEQQQGQSRPEPHPMPTEDQRQLGHLPRPGWRQQPFALEQQSLQQKPLEQRPPRFQQPQQQQEQKPRQEEPQQHRQLQQQPQQQERRPLQQQRPQQFAEEQAAAGKSLDPELRPPRSVAAVAATLMGIAGTPFAGMARQGIDGGVPLAAIHSARLRGLVFLGIFILGILVTVYQPYKKYSQLITRSPDMAPSFSSYMSSRLQIWLSERGESAKAKLTFLVSIVLLFLCFVIYWAWIGTFPSSAPFPDYRMIVDPSAWYREQTPVGRLIGVLMALGFLIILAVLFAEWQDSLHAYLERIRLGVPRVTEVGHILLVGYTEDTFTLIEELCAGYEPEGGTTIVLLAEESKEDMEEALRRAQLELRNSKVIVRSGHGHNIENLRCVSAESCATVVLMPKRSNPRDICDAITMQAMLALAGKDWPAKGRILAVCTLAQNWPLLETIGGPKCDIINVDDFMGKLMVRFSDAVGICKVVASLFSFDGNAFYMKPVPEHLVGLRFEEAQFYFPHSILAGILNTRNSEQILCPGMDAKLKDGDDLVLLAEDIKHIEVNAEPGIMKKPDRAGHSSTPSKVERGQAQKVESILILGWNHRMGRILLFELEDALSKGSNVLIVGPQPLAERSVYIENLQKGMNKKFVNLTIQHTVGRPESRQVLQDLPLPLAKASRIFVLSDATAATPAWADATTVSLVLTVRDMLHSSNENAVIPILPEFRDRTTLDMCEDLKVYNLLDSCGTPARIMATVAHRPRLAPVLLDLLSEHGQAHLAVRRLADYLPVDRPPPKSLCFWEALHYVAAQGDVLIGWSQSPQERAMSNVLDQRMAKLSGTLDHYEWDVNPPDKMKPRGWDDELHRLVVVAANDACNSPV